MCAGAVVPGVRLRVGLIAVPIWYHVTEDPDFVLDPSVVPENLNTWARDLCEPPRPYGRGFRGFLTVHATAPWWDANSVLVVDEQWIAPATPSVVIPLMEARFCALLRARFPWSSR